MWSSNRAKGSKKHGLRQLVSCPKKITRLDGDSGTAPNFQMYIIIRTINSLKSAKRGLNWKTVNFKKVWKDVISFQLVKLEKKKKNFQKGQLENLVVENNQPVTVEAPYEASGTVLRSMRSKYLPHIGEKQKRKISAKAG